MVPYHMWVNIELLLCSGFLALRCVLVRVIVDSVLYSGHRAPFLRHFSCFA